MSGATSPKINTNLYLVPKINVPKYNKNRFTRTIHHVEIKLSTYTRAADDNDAIP